MAKIIKTLSKLAQEHLSAEEEITAGLRVNLKGTALGVGLTVGIGGVLGSLAGSKPLKEGRDQASEAGIPFTQQMALGLTNERILLWSRSQLSGKPKDLLGEIPVSDIVDVLFEKGALGDRIAFTFSEEKVLELESVKVDNGEMFVKALKEIISKSD